MTAPRRPAERCATCNSVEAAHSGTCKHPFKPAPPEAALTRVGAVTAHRDAEEIEHIADEGIAVAGIPANFRGTLVGMMVEAYRLRHDEIAALRAAIRAAIGTTEKTRAEERFLRAACRARFDFYGAVKTTVEFRAAHGAMFGERLRAEARERGRKAK